MLSHPKISLERLKARYDLHCVESAVKLQPTNLERLKLDFKFGVHVDHSKSQPSDDKLSLKGAWSLSRHLFIFWKISGNISKTVRDSLIVSINLNRKSYVFYRMVVADDLGRLGCPLSTYVISDY